MAAGQFGQAGFDDPPAAVNDAAVEGRLADDVADDAHGGRVEAFLQRDPAAFGFIAHRADREVVLKHLAAAFMHHPHGGADFGVGIGGYVFTDEINESRFALQQAALDGSTGVLGNAVSPCRHLRLLQVGEGRVGPTVV